MPEKPLGAPQRLDAFMAGWLNAYYTQNQAVGARGGDFVTAPEISQMFGELLGLWLVEQYHRLNAPSSFYLVELGPGRGTLMADLLRVLPQPMKGALSLHLVEINPLLQAQQRKALQGMTPTWHKSLPALLSTLSQRPAPLFFVANEFFDALPIRQFSRQSGGGWQEAYVAQDKTGRWHRFFAPCPAPPAALPDLPPSVSFYEHGPMAQDYLAALASHMAQYGGAGLVIDYGEAGLRDSLQAVKDHRPVPLWEAIGQADITAHVNFAGLSIAAKGQGVRVFGPVPQGVFLQRLGIEQRAQTLAQGGKGAPGRPEVFAALHRLVSPTQMGHLFNVLGVTSDAKSPAPSGF